MTSPLPQRRAQVATAVGLVVGGLAFYLTLFDFRLDPTRTAVRLGYASNFFDLQAQAFLDGRVDVPTGSLGIEGFVIDERTYMYFPPFPALLRVPVMLLTDAFTGRLSLVSMGVAWVLFAAMTVLLLWLVHACLRGARPVTRLEAVAAAIFLAAATGGTVLTFDAALPWVYHEVYLWAVALVVGALYWVLRTVLHPTRTNALWLGGFALASALTRTTGGWAVCLVVVGVGGWLALGRYGPERRPAWRLVALAGGVPLAVAVLYNQLKFDHPYLFPLQDQVWTSVNQHRRDALAVNGGTITGPQFFLTSLVNYFRPDGVRFVDYFPWVTLPGQPAKAYGGVYLDQFYRTGSVTAFMPLLLLLSLASLPLLLRRTTSIERRALRPAVLAGVLVTGGVMAYGYVAYRSTSEFVPALVVAGAVGLWAVTGALEHLPAVARGTALTVTAALAAFGIAANLLTGVSVAATTYRGADLRDFVASQASISGGPGTALSRMVTQSDALPTSGVTDELHVLGDCDALYLNTGDAYEPWVLVEARPQVVEVRVDGRLHTGRVLLYTVHGTVDRHVYLETKKGNYARVVITTKAGDYAGEWFGVYRDSTFRVGIGVATDLGFAEVTSTPGGFVGFVPYIEWDASWNARPGSISPSFHGTRTFDRLGVTMTRQAGLPLDLCHRLLADSRA